MLVTTKEMLLDAQAGHYAVGAFNVESLEFVMAVIKAAEDRKSPVIMQTTPGTVKYANLDYFAAMCKVAAEQASVPVAIHLDHGDGFDRCIQAMHAGYTSVMIDGSHVPFEDNIALTASVTKVAGPIGIPDEAEEFVARTHCTSLAVGVGTAHGVYKGTPHIEQGVLKEIRSRLEIPLVLHGTSGVPDDQVAEAIANGICKVNYATELRQAFTRGFMGYMAQNPECFDPKKPNRPGMDEIYAVVASHMDNLGSSNKA